jgi:hypothetical protein
MERFLQSLLNMFLRRFMGAAINKGIDYAAGGGKPREEMTGAERDQAKQARQMAKRARQVSRFGRFFR